MSETITEENITTVDHTPVTENIPAQEGESATENAPAQEKESATENVTVQEEESATDNTSATAQENVTAAEPVTTQEDPFDKAEKERDSSGFFARFSSKIASIHSRREAKLVRDEIILSRIPDKDLMEYLRLEQRRMESQQHAREIREKRIWIAFQMTVALIAAVLVIYFLKDSPAILISILYTAGLLIAFNIWNKHKDGHSPKDQ